MSMLSEQIKELRKKADELRHVHADDASTGLLFAAMEAMREAADTIESLRDRLQAERTCEYVGDDVSGGCSVCRGWLDPACVYCPNCGAKVKHE